jgi:SPP1 gp7 family putative phage head morphogenesis protein
MMIAANNRGGYVGIPQSVGKEFIAADREKRHAKWRDLARPKGLVAVRRQEAFFARQLRKIAHHAGELITAWAIGRGDDILDTSQVPGLMDQLLRYADTITPWAFATVKRMMAEVAIHERRAFEAHGREMARGLRQELAQPVMADMLQTLIASQVQDIRSIPTDASARVYELILKGREDGTRAKAYVEEIMRSGEVSKAKANMLGRTMVSTVASNITEVRARQSGSLGYIFETMRDGTVRPSHRAMQGKFVAWDDPPTLDGYRTHAGRWANCRCFPRPVWPDF